MKMESLKDLYLEQLRDIYSAETQLVEALPKMAEAAKSPDLRSGFNQHLRQTREHVTRLERIFSALGEKPEGHTCHGMKGLIKEGEEMIKAKGEPEVIDAGLIAAAQRVEHYEIAGYMAAILIARELGEQEIASLLTETLSEEQEASRKVLGQATPLVKEAAAEDEVKMGSVSVVPHGTRKVAAGASH